MALVTSGPGATNAVTGIATAYMDSIPLVVITGQVPLPVIGTDAFQEVDTFGLTLPIVKHSYLVRDVRDLAAIIDEAFHIAASGKPGPVVIDIPKDITAHICGEPRTRFAHEFGDDLTPAADDAVIETIVDRLINAERPIFYVGGGIVTSNAAGELLRVVELLQAPVTPTLMGLGGFPTAHELSLGMLGMHGTYAANMGVSECDLLVAVGVRFDDRVTGKLATFASQAEIIHIDIDPSNIGKVKQPHISLVSDAASAMKRIAAGLAARDSSAVNAGKAKREAWWKKLNAWRRRRAVRLPIFGNRDKSAASDRRAGTIDRRRRRDRDRRRATPDVGSGSSIDSNARGNGSQAAAWERWVSACRPRWASQVGCPDKTVVAVVGDGGFQMTNQEIITAIQYKIPLKVLIMNNGYLGMVRQWQEMFYDRAYSEVDLSVSPDFVKLAEAYGALGLRASSPSEL